MRSAHEAGFRNTGAVAGARGQAFRLLGVAILGLAGFLPATVFAAQGPPAPAPAPAIVKWEQSPDLQSTGIDVTVVKPYLLADDFLCTAEGAITEIHVWGSWLNDQVMLGPITLSFHADVPAGPIPYSVPGEPLWWRTFQPAEYEMRLYAGELTEGWMTPPDQYLFPADTRCFEFIFRVPAAEAFIQRGTPDGPRVYWLDVQAQPGMLEGFLGWKTSLGHWNDDAVWGQGVEPYSGLWRELRYPPGHFFQGQSIDLAFSLWTEPVPEKLDYGDAPDPTYPTLLASDGARHVVVPGVALGPGLDPDPDGQPHPNALGDDNDEFDDEDGASFLGPLVPGAPVQFTVSPTVAGQLDVWVDLARDGVWQHPGDLFFSGVVPAGPQTLTVPVPMWAVPGQSFARFRFNTGGPLLPTGLAMDGEVEDHAVVIEATAPTKWRREPDLAPTGIDVNIQEPCLLADDFLCTEEGVITEIHVWGSYLNDQFMSERITLSIHADVPAGPIAYSVPGEVLWWRTFEPGEYEMRPYAEGLMEGWLNPPDQFIAAADTRCWEFIFHVPLTEAFIQRGTPDNPRVYWLDVQARPGLVEGFLGWKTSVDHFNDDAVWAQGAEPYPGPWHELRYPHGHPFQGQSIDLAFALRTEPVPEQFDYGDAPDPTYPTLLASNGARHRLAATHGPMLGNSVDWELDGQPDPNALGDDNNGIDDEDGVALLSALIPGQSATLSVTVTGGGVLQAWFDFGRDGGWSEPGDLAFNGALASGVHALTIAVPANAQPGPSFARFRISTAGGLSYNGLAPDGEVEDYAVSIKARPAESKWTQPPDLGPWGMDVKSTNPYLLADDFRCTRGGLITQISVWGSWYHDVLPISPAGQPDPGAVRFVLSLHADIPATQNPPQPSMPGEVLWSRGFLPGSFVAEPLPVGAPEGWFTPPATYEFPADFTCWRYTFTIDPTEAFHQAGSPEDTLVYWLDIQAYPLDGVAQFGWKTSLEHWNDDAGWALGLEPYPGPWFELRYPSGHPFEGQSLDLAFEIAGLLDPLVDYGDVMDPPYPTLAAGNGASHIIVPGIQLGAQVDGEGDGHPHVHALGDDNDALDDEDGVSIPNPLVVGQNAVVTVTVVGGGVLQAWFDFDLNGSWADAGENVYNGYLPAGVYALNIGVPAGATPGLTYARFRLSAAGGLTYDGPALNGEVEDYEVLLTTQTGTPEPASRMFMLYPSMPNPFQASTAIRFELPAAQEVSLQVFSIDGRLVANLVREEMPEGSHTVTWNGQDDSGRPVASGVYLYHLKAGSYRASQRMLLLR